MPRAGNTLVFLAEPAASEVIRQLLAAADTQPAHQVLGDGRHNWGPGGTTATDVSLFRWTTKILASDSLFFSNRQTVNDAAFQAGYASTSYWYMNAAGGMNWGSGAAWDTNLYRSAAGYLKTDNNLQIGGDTQPFTLNATSYIRANWQGGANEVVLGYNPAAGNAPYIIFGTNNAWDTNLYRSAAGVLKTDGILNAVGGLQVNGVAVTAGGTMVKLYDNQLAASAASIDITSISQGYANLVVLMILRADVGEPQLNVRINGDSAANYYSESITLNGTTTAPSVTETNGGTQISNNQMFSAGSTHPAGTFSVCRVEIFGYSMTTNLKYGLFQWNRASSTSAGAYTHRHGGFWWNSQAAINRITISPASGNFVANSRVIIYGY